MKKVSLLIAMIAFVCGNAFAQMSFDFNDCPAGAKIAQTLGDPWTTWSNAPGGAEDGVFGEAGGTMAAHFTYGNDQVLNLGNVTTGTWELSFDMYIPNGKDAYNNILHIFNGSGSEWATEVWYKTSDNGTAIKAANVTTNFDCPYDSWFTVKYVVDLDNDEATFYVDDAEIYTWQFSLQAEGAAGTRQLGAMDFYPPTSAAVSDYYIDNVDVQPVMNLEVVLEDDFEEYTEGNKIAAEAIAAGHDWWTTWSNAPGGAEDGVVASFEGTKCGHLTYGNDQVLLLGDATSGTYTLGFDMYIPNGKDAYNNVLHIFNGSGSEWATEVWYKTSDNGTSIKAGGVTTNFDCPFDSWFTVKYVVDLDNDEATFYVDDEEIYTWQYSLQADGTAGSRQLAAIDFYPPTSAAVSEYYVDNIEVEKVGGSAAPHFVVTPTAVTQELEEDDITMVEVSIENAGNSIGDWYGWLQFEQGGAGSQTSELYYHDGQVASGIGSSGAVTREMAIRLPASAYAGAAMGMRIVSAKYYIYDTYQSTDYNYIFHIYGQGPNGQPGQMLAEKTVHSTDMGVWITATFDEEVYMTGEAMWIGVQLEQGAGEYPLSMDGGEYGEIQDGNWLNSNGGPFSHCYSAPSGSSDGFQGAWLITATCQGELVPATWVTMDKTEGSVLGGQSETLTLTLNSIGLPMGTNYNSTLVINTNDEDLPIVEIPVALAVTDGVVETATQLASIYPNPATSVVTLEGDNLNSVAIYNVAGQLVRVVKLDSMVNNIDMNVEAGVYFFSIYDNNGNNSVTRVVITK